MLNAKMLKPRITVATANPFGVMSVSLSLSFREYFFLYNDMFNEINLSIM